MKKNECTIHVDFIKPYESNQEDEIQSSHFSHTNFSIFTTYGHFRSSNDTEFTKIPTIVISEIINDESRVAAHT